MYGLVPLQFGLPAPPELIVLLIIIIILFGADKIPELARSSGKALGEFRKGKQEIEEELDDEEAAAGNDDTSDVSAPAEETAEAGDE